MRSSQPTNCTQLDFLIPREYAGLNDSTAHYQTSFNIPVLLSQETMFPADDLSSVVA